MTVVKGYEAAWPECRVPSCLRCSFKSFKIFIQLVFSILIKSKYAVALNFIERRIRFTAYDTFATMIKLRSMTVSQTVSLFAFLLFTFLRFNVDLNFIESLRKV